VVQLLLLLYYNKNNDNKISFTLKAYDLKKDYITGTHLEIINKLKVDIGSVFRRTISSVGISLLDSQI